MNDIEYTKMNEVESNHFWYKTLHGLVIQQMDYGNRLIDLGCGTGGLISKIKSYFKEAEGTDYSDLSLEYAKRKNAEVVFFRTDLNSIEFAKSYDVITCIDVLEYIENNLEFLKKVYQSLENNGKFIINVPAFQWLVSYHDEKVGQNKRYSKIEIIELLKNAGFKIEYATFWNMILFPILLVKRKLIKSENSDVDDMNPMLNRILFSITRIELFLTKMKISLPFGSSIFVVARK